MNSPTPPEGTGPGVSRRDVLRFAIASSLLGGLWAESADAAVPRPPTIQFTPNRTGDGIVSRYGEVRIANVDGTALPVIVNAAGGLAAIDLTGPTASIRYGSGNSAIVLTAYGIQFGTASTPVGWSRATITRLMDEVARDVSKARGAVLLRSAYLIGYPVAVTQLKHKSSRAGAERMARSADGVAAGSLICVTRTISETVYETITRIVEQWLTAEQQYRQCFDRTVAGACKDAPGWDVGRASCAAAICSVQTFADKLIGTFEVVEQVARETVRRVTTCAQPLARNWPNPWDVLRQMPERLGLNQASQQFSPSDITGAVTLLRQVQELLGRGTIFLGPFARCLLSGRWELAALATPIGFGDGTVAVPYGVRVHITRSCAKSLTAAGVATELANSWEVALRVLATLSPEFATYAAGIGITAIAGPVSAMILGAGPAVKAAATLILGVIILALIYGTAITAQITAYDLAGMLDSNGDGRIYIEHPTFALALVKIATMTLAPVELIPPYVNPS